MGALLALTGALYVIASYYSMYNFDFEHLCQYIICMYTYIYNDADTDAADDNDLNDADGNDMNYDADTYVADELHRSERTIVPWRVIFHNQ